MTPLSMLKQLPETNFERDNKVLLWHQDCLAATVLLASALSEREMKRVFRRAGYDTKDLDGGALLERLHEACHQDSQVSEAVAKGLGRRFQNTLARAGGLTAQEIVERGAGQPWPIPLVWAAYQSQDPKVRQAGRQLAHLAVLKGLKGLRAGQSRLASGQERQARLEAQNRELGVRLGKLRRENDRLKAELSRRPAQGRAEPAAPVPKSGANRNEVKKLRKLLHQQKQQLKEAEDKLAVWRSLALSAEQAGGDAKPEAPECAGGQVCDSAKAAACPRSSQCPLRGRKVAVIGGLDRLEKNYCQVVERMGGECLFHTGTVRSGAQGLRNVVTKSDLVVYITPINNHGAMKVVKKQCKRCRKPFCPLQGASAGALENLLWQMDGRK